jgi:hypothetical protein
MSKKRTLADMIRDATGGDVEVTIRGLTADEKVAFTISGNQFDAMRAAGYMVKNRIATLDSAESDIEDRDVSYWYMTQL